MTLLQILAEIQVEGGEAENSRNAHAIPSRAVVLAVEEPELYMHPQMERRMRGVLYRLAAETSVEVISTANSPIFLHFSRYHKTVGLAAKSAARLPASFEVANTIYRGGV